MKLVERPVPKAYRQQMLRLGGGIDYVRSLRVFESDTVRALMSKQPCGSLPSGTPDMRWHISVSVKGQERLPTWDELKEVRQQLKPDLFFVIGMPPEKYWMSYAEVLHLAETKDENMIQQWIYEGKQAERDRAAGAKPGDTLDDMEAKRRGSKG